MRISDWSSDVCSSDLKPPPALPAAHEKQDRQQRQSGNGRRRGQPCGKRATRTRPHPDRDEQQQRPRARPRSEEHTSELQSLMRISYAVFCLKKKKTQVKTQAHSNSK